MGSLWGCVLGKAIRSYVLDIQCFRCLLDIRMSDSDVECTNLKYRREVWPRGTHLGIYVFIAIRLNEITKSVSSHSRAEI